MTSSVLWIPAWSASIQPNQLVKDHWGSRDGLPEGGVLSLFEDPKGFLWVGTECCIVNFDGFQFRLLDHELGNLGQFSFVRDIESDYMGGFWMAMVGGVAHYDGRRFSWFGPEQGLVHPFVYSIFPSTHPTIGTGGDGIWYLKNGLFERDINYVAMPGNINDLQINQLGNLVAATDAGLVERYTNGTWTHQTPNDSINSILIDEESTLWLATDRGLLKKQSNGHIQPINALKDQPIYSLKRSESKTVWAGSENRVYSISSESIESVEHDLGKTNALLIDQHKNIWIGGAKGLARLKVGSVETSGKKEGMAENSINAIISHPIAGLWVIDDQGRLGHWVANRFQALTEPGSVPGSGMTGLTVDHENVLWIAQGSLGRFENGRLQNFDVPGSDVSLVEAGPKGLWLGKTQSDGESSIYFIPNESLESKTLANALSQVQPLSISFPLRHIQRIYQSENNTLWISTGGTGLIQYNLANRTAKRFDETNGLPSNYVYSLVKDSKAGLWVATRSGIALIKDGRIISYADVSGAPTRSPVHLHLDRRDRLWVTADDGVYVVDRDSLLNYKTLGLSHIISRRLTTRDGLRSSVISWRRNGQAAVGDDALYYATLNGLSYIDTGNFSITEATPDILISSVQLGEKYLNKSAAVVIRNRQEHLLIKFSAPDLSEAHRLEFRSRLVRNNKHGEALWSTATTNRYVQFSNLSPGKYFLEINVRYAGQAWGDKAVNLYVVVPPLFYEKTSVQVILFICVILASLLWGRRKLKQAEFIEAQLRNRVNERTLELSREIEVRKTAEKAASDLAKNLEIRVQERTAQLELAKMATKRSKERFELAVKGAEDGIWDWDITLNQLYVSPRWLSIMGHNNASFSVHIENWLSNVHPDDADRLKDIFIFKNDHSSFRLEYRMMHKRGSYIWVLTRGVVVRDSQGDPIRAAGSQTDISARKLVEHQLQRRVMEDMVTGLPNRILFSDRLSQALKKDRSKTYLVAVLYVDIDQFRGINEQYGHEMGDFVLRECAQRIQKSMRTADSVARIGNDEFAILMQGIESEQEAKNAAERIHREFTKSFVNKDVTLNITCSIGIKLGKSNEANAQDFLMESELALAEAKSYGGDRLAQYDTVLKEETKARRGLESELKRALEGNEFILYYQPMIDPMEGTIVGFEALSRWQHPDRGLLGPYHFIGMLEACGLIIPFSQWVLKEACRQASLWQNKFNQNIRISINIPAHQVSGENLVKEVMDALASENLTPGTLCLEIVENSLLESQQAVLLNLAELRERGVKVAIDDFGTGYSSFSYLEKFPVDRVKIDRSFCKSVPENPKTNAILVALIKMIRELDLVPVVEGVETKEQLEFLAALGAPIIQGYYFSKPIASNECDALITDSPKNWKIQ